MADEGSPYQGNLFPCSYFVLYCPYDDCALDTPFKEAQSLLEHLEGQHRTRIENSNAVIPVFDSYLAALKQAGTFSKSPETSDVLLGGAGDEEVRATLQRQKLAAMLELQAKERAGLYRMPRQCLFCTELSSSLKDLFTHMFKEHGFNIGLLDNLVMVETFLSTLEGILRKNVCIFCHNEFRSAGCLRKHMRNKYHYKIDPKNHFYDKYYIVNYVKCGALGNDAAEKDGVEEAEEENNDWDDLDETVDLRTTCLFCEQVFASPSQPFLDHCRDAHHFDLDSVRREFSKGRFYNYIKFITYIRHRISNFRCPACEAAFDRQQDLEYHLDSERHCKVPDQSLWDQPQYLFPLFDDDPILFFFGDDAPEEPENSIYGQAN